MKLFNGHPASSTTNPAKALHPSEKSGSQSRVSPINIQTKWKPHWNRKIPAIMISNGAIGFKQVHLSVRCSPSRCHTYPHKGNTTPTPFAISIHRISDPRTQVTQTRNSDLVSGHQIHDFPTSAPALGSSAFSLAFCSSFFLSFLSFSSFFLLSFAVTKQTYISFIT
jgi:hypothetical protein